MVVRGKYRLIVAALVYGRKYVGAYYAVLLVVGYFHVVKVNPYLDGRACGKVGDAFEIGSAYLNRVLARYIGVYLVYDARFVHYVQVKRLYVQSYRVVYVIGFGIVRHKLVAARKQCNLIVVTLEYR